MESEKEKEILNLTSATVGWHCDDEVLAEAGTMKHQSARILQLAPHQRAHLCFGIKLQDFAGILGGEYNGGLVSQNSAPPLSLGCSELAQ